jgi:hypothetical protein
MWNESWYFDVADPHQRIGAYFRLGVDPARGISWNTTVICGPDRPMVSLVDFAAPLPDDDLTVRTEALESTQVCELPLERYRVTVRGEGAELDLVWTSAGQPFLYRRTTRYEIPCTVSGTLRVGDETFEFQDAPGQRDHSWGVRDWWSINWIWSAGHLDDGTHLHGLDLRLQNGVRLGTGYVQSPQGELTELREAPADEQMQPDGLGGPTTQRFGELDVTFAPVGHAPLRLTGEDGREAFFPRAWAELSTSDGRSGVGWIEWNVGSAAD